MTTGYSGTPLAQKLNLKPGLRTLLLDPPLHFADLLGPMYTALDFVDEDAADRDILRDIHLDYIHWFVRERAALPQHLPRRMRQLAPTGMLWVSWPKKAAKIATDMTEDCIREYALPLGLVDSKVCAIDATWSGLKLAIRRERRGK